MKKLLNAHNILTIDITTEKSDNDKGSASKLLLKG